MARLTGAATLIGFDLHSVVNTAIALGASDKMLVESIEWSENAEELRQNPIGSGLLMDSASQRGAVSPTVSFNGKPGYNDPYMAVLSQLFGTEGLSATGGGFYNHSFIVNETRNGRWGVLAGQTTTTGVEEILGCTVTALTITAENPPNYVDFAVEMLANQIVYDSSTNTTATMANLTVANDLRIVVKDTDEFQINAQGGSALSASDQVDIESAVIEFTFDQEHVREIKDEAGNGEPRSTGSPPFGCTLTVTFRSLEDFTWLNAHQDGTEYKAKLNITDSSDSNYFFRVDLPRLLIVESPSRPIGNAGDNPLTVVFKGLVASSNPTGMSSRYPMIVVKNNKSTAYNA